MTNLFALTVVVVTNWVEVGQFCDMRGNGYQIFQGTIRTNTVGQMTYENQTMTQVLKSETGPMLKQQKVVPYSKGGPGGPLPKPLELNFTLPAKITNVVNHGKN